MIAIGALVLVGWALDVAVLKSIVPGLVTMKANTAVCFILCGLAMILLREGREGAGPRRLAAILTGTMLTLAVLSLAEYFLGRNLGIDQMLFRESQVAGIPAAPGRMAPATAAGFTLMGVALMLLLKQGSSRAVAASQGLAVLGGFNALLAIGGTLYRAPALVDVSIRGVRAAMAVSSGVAFGLLTLAMLAARPGAGFVATVTSPRVGGATARRLLPFAILVPLTLGLLFLQGHAAGWYGINFGLVLLAVSNVVVLTTGIFFSARSLNRTAAEREHVDERAVWLASFPERNPIPIVELDPVNRTIHYLNPSARECFPDLQGAGVDHPWLSGLPALAEPLLDGTRREARRDIRIGNTWYAQTIAAPPGLRRLRVYGIDITERKRMENASREGDVRLQAVIENLTEGLIIASLDGQLLHWNRSSLEMHGYHDMEEGLRGLAELADTFELRTLDGAPVAFEDWPMTRVLRGEVVRDYEVQLIRFEPPSTRAVSYSGEIIRDAAGKSLAYLAMNDFTTRRATQQALREKEEQLHAADRRLAEIVHGMTEACFALDAQWRFTFINERGEALFRISREDVLGRSIWDVFHKLLGTTMEAHYRRAMKERVPVAFEAFSPIAVRWLDIRLFPTSEGIAAFLLDIQARKLAEEALRESEEQFRTMANSIPQLAWMAHGDGAIFWYNRRWFDYTGTTPEAMEGWGWQSVHDPETLPKVLEGWRGAISSGRPFEMEFPLRGADGQFRMFLTRVQPLKDLQGSVVQWFGTNTDVDELNRMDESLRAAQARLNSTLYAGSIGTWTWDIVRDCLTADEFTASKFSIDAEIAAKGLPAEAYLRAVVVEDRQDVADALARAIEACGHYDIEYRVLQRDGSRTWLQAKGRVDCDEAGNALSFHGAVIDITGRKLAEEALRHLNENLEQRVIERTAQLEAANQELELAGRHKSEFLASMSHELRTPLNGIIGFAEFLVDEKPGPLLTKQKEYLGDVLISARHLLQLINDVLDMARVESGKMELYPEIFSVEAAIREVTSVIEGIAQKKRIPMTIDVGVGLEAVRLDLQKFKQVLYNLLSNAVKFTADQGRVDIQARRLESDCLEIRVRDSGIGIKAADMSKLFVEFAQLDSGNTRRFDGSGLGLALIRKIVEFQGGHVGVESELGKGSTFSVVLPL
ncbi:MAG: PAS domain S-box protein [Acidobacteriota bacterium]